MLNTKRITFYCLLQLFYSNLKRSQHPGNWLPPRGGKNCLENAKANQKTKKEFWFPSVLTFLQILIRLRLDTIFIDFLIRLDTVFIDFIIRLDTVFIDFAPCFLTDDIGNSCRIKQINFT